MESIENLDDDIADSLYQTGTIFDNSGNDYDNSVSNNEDDKTIFRSLNSDAHSNQLNSNGRRNFGRRQATIRSEILSR